MNSKTIAMGIWEWDDVIKSLFILNKIITISHISYIYKSLSSSPLYLYLLKISHILNSHTTHTSNERTIEQTNEQTTMCACKTKL